MCLGWHTRRYLLHGGGTKVKWNFYWPSWLEQPLQSHCVNKTDRCSLSKASAPRQTCTQETFSQTDQKKLEVEKASLSSECFQGWGKPLPSQSFLLIRWKPVGHRHSYPILRSLQIWEQPPLLYRHSLEPEDVNEEIDHISGQPIVGKHIDESSFVHFQINHLPLTAFPQGLIRPIPAISLLVANIFHADTLPTGALKSGRALTVGYCKGKIDVRYFLHTDQRWTQKEWTESRTINATNFITHIPAVVLVVTLAAAVDAGAIAACKFVRTACRTCCRAQKEEPHFKLVQFLWWQQVVI